MPVSSASSRSAADRRSSPCSTPPPTVNHQRVSGRLGSWPLNSSSRRSASSSSTRADGRGSGAPPAAPFKRRLDDLEVLRPRRGPGELEPPHGRRRRCAERVAHGVVVHPPRDHHPLLGVEQLGGQRQRQLAPVDAGQLQRQVVLRLLAFGARRSARPARRPRAACPRDAASAVPGHVQPHRRGHRPAHHRAPRQRRVQRRPRRVGPHVQPVQPVRRRRQPQPQHHRHDECDGQQRDQQAGAHDLQSLTVT